VALGHHRINSIPPDSPDLRLDGLRLWIRLRSLHLSHLWLPDQLSLPVSSQCNLITPFHQKKKIPLNKAFLPYSYFVVTHIAKDQGEVIRYAALLRGTESAWQAVSYGLTSLTVFAQVGGIYMNFALWAIAIAPAWLVLRNFGSGKEEASQWDRESGTSSGEASGVVVAEENHVPAKVHET
jgi:hypothetical protein